LHPGSLLVKARRGGLSRQPRTPLIQPAIDLLVDLVLADETLQGRDSSPITIGNSTAASSSLPTAPSKPSWSRRSQQVIAAKACAHKVVGYLNIHQFSPISSCVQSSAQSITAVSSRLIEASALAVSKDEDAMRLANNSARRPNAVPPPRAFSCVGIMIISSLINYRDTGLMTKSQPPHAMINRLQ
jgi:hypothetical protein